ncbi:MAG TPA: MFS transporter [Gammaproteobacteria bacterium]|jgi:sugar phosphate permease|nr:MFS transporter [Gammaproteobacteria bacterium]
MIANNRAMTFSFMRSIYPWLIVACGMLFYCYNYFLRVSPSVMQADLTHAFHITATQFGTLAAFYYYAYTPMQVPAGMIYDRFGARFVLCSACLVASLGLAVFVAADSFAMAGAGRFMVGLGCAFAYIGTLKLASIWLPPNRFATVAGVATAIGMVSGAMAQKYLAPVVEAIGYQEALRSAIFAGIALSIFLIFLVRSTPKNLALSNVDQTAHANMTTKQLFAALRIIFTNRQMWLIGIIGCLLYLPSSVFLDLWGIPYLKSVYQLTSQEAVNISSYTFYGWIISGPIIGILSDKIKRRRLPLIVSGFFAAALLCVVFYIPGLTLSGLYATFFMIGFCCGGHPLCFALGKESNPIQISATSVAVTNMLIMAGGAIFQPVVGKLLDLHTTSPIGLDGLPAYSGADYTFALSVIPLGVALGIFLSLFLKETYCESQASEEDEKIFRPDTATARTPAFEGATQ